ncbi:MAG: hypothetical protein KBB83_03015 [Alphaproteobacteria bacterium]|nr:hypothetical protein [Alphaproteobacteria bacterium]
MWKLIILAIITITIGNSLYASVKRDRIEDTNTDSLSLYKRSCFIPGHDFNEDDLATIDCFIEDHLENKLSRQFLDDVLVAEQDMEDIAAAEHVESLYDSEYIRTTDSALAHYDSQKGKTLPQQIAAKSPKSEMEETDYEREMIKLCEEIEAALDQSPGNGHSPYPDSFEECEYDDEQDYFITPPEPSNPLGFKGRVLKSNNDHQMFMIEAIKKARNKILITSHNFSANTKNHPHLFSALQQASEKGVKVMLCHQKGGLNLKGYLPKNIEKHKVNCHSKVLAVDKSILAIGSFDWLQDPTYLYAESLNESISFEEDRFKPFIKSVWRTAKMYKHVTNNPDAKVQINDIYENTAPETIFGYTSDIELIQTPQRHREILKQAFYKADHSITICASIVINYPKFLEQYLPIDLVSAFLASECNVFGGSGNKTLQIFYNPKGRTGEKTNREILEAHLSQVIQRPNLILTPIEGLHQKSLIVDNDVYMIGSFNLLSSADNVIDKTHRMETSVLLTGSAASEIIKNFLPQ